jgi:hypothetical protein
MTTFDPASPDGTNASLGCAISANGATVTGQCYVVPARCGVAVRLAAGQRLVVINTHGTQVGDFWAFNAVDLGEYMSMEHVHVDLGTIFPAAGDRLITNRRRAILQFEEDTSPGVHDTVIAPRQLHRQPAPGADRHRRAGAGNSGTLQSVDEYPRCGRWSGWLPADGFGTGRSGGFPGRDCSDRGDLGLSAGYVNGKRAGRKNHGPGLRSELSGRAPGSRLFQFR